MGADTLDHGYNPFLRRLNQGPIIAGIGTLSGYGPGFTRPAAIGACPFPCYSRGHADNDL
jgi:hypothetical protein